MAGDGDVYDVIIIGGGPAGATAAIYAARGELSTLVLDRGLRAGALGMAGQIANYPGVLGEISGAELLDRMRHQAESFGARFKQERVLGVDLERETKQVWGSKGMYQAKALIIASGSMGRTHSIPGEERLVGAGVSYCATCDGAFFRDQQVVVAGGNDEALEEVLFLTRFARQVDLLVPTPELRASVELAEQVRQHPKVTIHLSTRVREVVGQHQVEGVRITGAGDTAQTLPASGVFIYLQGGKPITDFVGVQLPTSDKGCLDVDGNMQTVVPGVFAVGDVLCTHLKQAVISAAEGARAAMAVQRYLSGRSTLRPDWA